LEEIRLKWEQYKPKPVKDIFSRVPRYANPYDSGVVTAAFLENGLNMTRFVRYLAGLSEDVVLDAKFIDQAQHAAVLLARLNTITHNPSKPADMAADFFSKGRIGAGSSNLHMSWGTVHTLEEAVLGFCDDSDPSNISRLGHRRWVLDPALKKTGFGYAETSRNGSSSFIAMQVLDKGAPFQPDSPVDHIAWPNAGYFPSDVFSNGQAWSVSLNPRLYTVARCQPRVTLTKVTEDGTADQKWIFSKPVNLQDRYFQIDRNNYGLGYCIIFRPDNPGSFTGARFTVKIEGLINKQGDPVTLEYEVIFFTLPR
jgi:hypothetical protein